MSVDIAKIVACYKRNIADIKEGVANLEAKGDHKGAKHLGQIIPFLEEQINQAYNKFVFAFKYKVGKNQKTYYWRAQFVGGLEAFKAKIAEWNAKDAEITDYWTPSLDEICNLPKDEIWDWPVIIDGDNLHNVGIV